MDELRQALRRLAKAVVVISSRYQGQRYAMAATAVSELSFDPPSMLICVNRTASLYPVLAAGAPFCINILHHSQIDIAQLCSGSIKGEARFQQGDWRVGIDDVPWLFGAQASVICRTVKSIEHGTHGVYIGDVVEVMLDGEPEPLIYMDGRYTIAAAAGLER